MMLVTREFKSSGAQILQIQAHNVIAPTWRVFIKGAVYPQINLIYYHLGALTGQGIFVRAHTCACVCVILIYVNKKKKK